MFTSHPHTPNHLSFKSEVDDGDLPLLPNYFGGLDSIHFNHQNASLGLCLHNRKEMSLLWIIVVFSAFTKPPMQGLPGNTKQHGGERLVALCARQSFFNQ